MDSLVRPLARDQRGDLDRLHRDPHGVGQPFPHIPGFYGVQLAMEPPVVLYFSVDDEARVVTLLELYPLPSGW